MPEILFLNGTKSRVRFNIQRTRDLESVATTRGGNATGPFLTGLTPDADIRLTPNADILLNSRIVNTKPSNISAKQHTPK